MTERRLNTDEINQRCPELFQMQKMLVNIGVYCEIEAIELADGDLRARLHVDAPPETLQLIEQELARQNTDAIRFIPVSEQIPDDAFDHLFGDDTKRGLGE